MTAEQTAQQTDELKLSKMVREGSDVLHKKAERRPFMRVFFRSQLTKDQYAEWLGRLSYVYAALEEVAEELKGDSQFARFFLPELFRSQRIDQDLKFFVGDDWRSRITPSPVTKEYADRIRWTGSSWKPGYIAHQWLRYLGSLSGGKVLKGLVQKAYSLPDDSDGLEFYKFPEVSDPMVFLKEYHEKMDTMGFDEETRAKIVDEANRAFQFNIDLTDELAADLGIETPPGDESSEIDALKHEH
jgi:heme oxygenase